VGHDHTCRRPGPIELRDVMSQLNNEVYDLIKIIGRPDEDVSDDCRTVTTSRPPLFPNIS